MTYLPQVLYDVSNGNWILDSGSCAAMLTFLCVIVPSHVTTQY
jgi:hypothetical protein